MRPPGSGFVLPAMGSHGSFSLRERGSNLPSKKVTLPFWTNEASSFDS